MRIAVHQPNYLPWLGFFEKMRSVDAFVLLDDAEFSKSTVENRNRIKTPEGEFWLTVPVRTADRKGQRFNEVEIDNTKHWAQKHWQNLLRNYRRSPYFAIHSPFFKQAYGRKWDKLLELNVHLNTYLSRAMGISTKTVFSSELGVKGEGSLRLIDICKKLGAGTYFSGEGAKAYMDDELFARSGVTVVYQHFASVAYSQLYGEFMPNLSAVDYLFNCVAASPDI